MAATDDSVDGKLQSMLPTTYVTCPQLNPTVGEKVMCSLYSKNDFNEAIGVQAELSAFSSIVINEAKPKYAVDLGRNSGVVLFVICSTTNRIDFHRY